GVHTPKFAIEHDLAKVRNATAAEGVAYAVALDNQHQIWRAFSNQAWPAFYFIDAEGQQRNYVSGEGAYDRQERLIQQLLLEANGARNRDPVGLVRGLGAQAEADFANLRSPETYTRLYQLIRQKAAIRDRTFEIEFFDKGVRAYVFTFG